MTIAELICAARAGQAAALAEVRGWAAPAHASGPPRWLRVRADGVLSEPARDRLRRRREVFAPLPSFGQDDPLLQGLPALTRQACAAVRDCPPLARHLQQQAARHLWALERRLYADDTLQAPQRRRLERELQQLRSLQRPLWESWVHATPAWRHDEFDALVQQWLDAPVDWGEQHWFMPDWRVRPVAFAAAGALVAALRPPLRQYLGVELVRLKAGRFEVQGAKLEAAADAATRWAERIGLPWRFEPEPPPSAAPGASTGAACQSTTSGGDEASGDGMNTKGADEKVAKTGQADDVNEHESPRQATAAAGQTGQAA